MINKTMDKITVAMVAKPDLAFGVSVEGKVRILQGLWLNLETKCCGEVIGNEVQLWNWKQVTRVRLSDWGKKHDLEHNKEPENMIKNRKHNKWPENKNIKT